MSCYHNALKLPVLCLKCHFAFHSTFLPVKILPTYVATQDFEAFPDAPRWTSSHSHPFQYMFISYQCMSDIVVGTG